MKRTRIDNYLGAMIAPTLLLGLLPRVCTAAPPAHAPAHVGKVDRATVPPRPPDYLHDIRPILTANCFSCHGMDDKKRQAGLRLDKPEGAFAKTHEGDRPIIPGKPLSSEVYLRITARSESKMPPEASGKRLTQDEIATIRRWISAGAKYQPHWAFVAPRRPAAPRVQHATWVRGPIDAFIAERLERNGLAPSPEADRYTLIRRLSLDLIGLPPTPSEVKAFIEDRSPDAYARVVDRLLSSPRFGEKWARKWLDIARYADSAGYGSDPLRPNLWPYRDWLINALNKNLPYDRFITEQVAGDLLPNPTPEQLIATAFNRNTMTNTEGGTDREEFRTAAVLDRSITTMQAFTGLTLGCAKCHSHKFDPITNEEFYRFTAFFNQTEDNDQPDERPTAPLTPELEAARAAELKRQLESDMAAAAKEPQSSQAAARVLADKKALDGIKPVALPIMKELPPEKHRHSHVLVLGNFLLPAAPVQPGFPAAFPPPPAGAPANRLGVAEWLVSRSNPLTARVEVNRIWAQLFGTGIVETEEDFGQQGALPSHPELIDWLAVEFMERGWDMKAIIREIVCSGAYRQSCRVSAAGLAKDARDRLLWRYPRRRLDAETVRDQALALSGLLSEKLGGPSVFPPQPDGLWQAAFNGQRSYPTSTGEDRYRRGIYTFWRRTSPNPSMATFDAPSREICTLRRFPTNTPLQALVTLNDPAYLEMAQALARRIVRESGAAAASGAAGRGAEVRSGREPGPVAGTSKPSTAGAVLLAPGADATGLTGQVRFALELVQARPAQAAEIAPLVELYNREHARYAVDRTAAKRLAAEPIGPLPEGADPADLAAWTVVCNVLLNMDSVLTAH